jgi:putative membrane protein
MRAKLWLLGGLAIAGALGLLVEAQVAYAHGGILPGQNPLTAWKTNPLPSLFLFLAAYLYVNGLSRWEHPSHPMTPWQRISFFAGLFAIFLALQSPIDPLSEHQFSIHQIQHLLMRMVAPLLVLLGAPLTPMLRGLPPWALHGVVRPMARNPVARRGYQILTNPIVTTVMFLGFLYIWQVPYLHNLAVRNDYIHEAMHITMLFSGFLFWWLVIDPKPHRSRLHYGLRVLYVGLIVIPNTLLGAGITFNGNLIYDAYYDFEQPLGLDPLVDQQLGGLVLWIVGDMMSIIAAGAVMVLWYQREQEEEQVDAASH